MIKSLWMLVASLLFALMAAFARMGASDFSALELVFYRSAFGAAVIALWVWAQGFTLRTPLVRAHFMRSFLGTFALTIWFYAISKLPLGTAMTLNYTSPLYMALIVIFLAVKNGESFSRASAAAVVLGFFGVTLVLKPELSPGQTFPALVGLTSGFFAALAYFQIRQLSRMQEPEWRIVFYFTLFGTIAGLIACYVVEGGLHMPNAQGLVGILGMGLCATLGQICTTRSYAYGNMLLSSCLGFSAIPFSVIISFFWFGESVTAATLTGAAVILCSGMMATVATKRTEAAEKAARAAEETAKAETEKTA